MEYIKNKFVEFNQKRKERKNKPKVKKDLKTILQDNIKSFAIALFFALLIRSFLIQAFYIPSGSMKPGLLPGDYVFVTKYNYGYTRHSLPFSIPLIPSSRIFYKEPEAGDVVIFKYPGDKRTDYVKRLIAKEGDTIQIINSVVFINGVALKREYITTEIDDEGIEVDIFREYIGDKSYLIRQITNYSFIESDYYGPYTLKKDQFFMMGDNRDMSKDSRFDDVGPVDKSLLIGKGGMIFFSIEGSFLQFWKWFNGIRFERFFNLIK